ncbi:MAG: sensor histidine kinase [Isosphaeraceae bacterium]
MTTTAGRTEPHVESVLGDLIIVDEGTTHATEVAELLSARGHRIQPTNDVLQARKALERKVPDVLVMIHHAESGNETAHELLATASRRGIPVLLVVDDSISDLSALGARLAEVDDWVTLGGVATELLHRVERLVRRSRCAASNRTGQGSVVFGPQFLPLVVHDLRTPLNVMGLSLRILGQVVPREDPDVQQDMRFLDENFQLMVRMLQQLSDYHRLFENRGEFEPIAFDPRRLADEVIAELRSKSPQRAASIVLELEPSCPGELSLDPMRARLGLHYALINATAAANKTAPVRLRLRGDRDRCVIEVIVEQAPPPTVSSCELNSLEFERIQGTEFERRGMDLAIVARVCELFGGHARLVVVEGKESRISLEWAAQIEAA